jgi:hypothetical protein
MSITLIFTLQKAHAQASVPLPGASIASIAADSVRTGNQILAITDSIWKVSAPFDTSEGGPKQAFQRLKAFTESRLSPSRAAGAPLKLPYYNALKKAYHKTAVCGEPLQIYGGYRGTWQVEGRTPDTNAQADGVVRAVWQNPLYPNVVLIGTDGAGVWKTTNATARDSGKEVHWRPLTDKTDIGGTMGISAMAVNPFDSNDIYVGAAMNNMYGFNGGQSSGFGLWHSTDGGLTWQLEQNGINTTPIGLGLLPYIGVNALEFAPYTVNGNAMLVMSSWKGLFAKVGSGSWFELTPPGGYPRITPGELFNVTDINFLPDQAGRIIVCNDIFEQDPGAAMRPFAYLIEFNTMTGQPAGPCRQIIDKTILGLDSNQVISLAVEYVGGPNKLLYIGWESAIVNGTGLTLANNIHFASARLLPADTALTSKLYLTQGLSPLFSNNTIFDFKASKIAGKPIFYVATDMASITYDSSSGIWQSKFIQNYSGQTQLHPDIRAIHIGKDVPTTTAGKGVGYDQVVYYATDGGISKCSKFDVTKQLVTTAGSTDFKVATVQNLNGPELIIGAVIDADADPQGYALTDAAYHSGIKIRNNKTMKWRWANPAGDGLNASFDKRFIKKDTVTFLDHINDQIAIKLYIPSTNAVVSSSLPFWGNTPPDKADYSRLPFNTWKTKVNGGTPANPFLMFGLMRAYISHDPKTIGAAASYFDDTLDFELKRSWNIAGGPIYNPLFQHWGVDSITTKQILRPRNDERTAFLLSPNGIPENVSKRNGQLNAGRMVFTKNNLGVFVDRWNWWRENDPLFPLDTTTLGQRFGKDITPPHLYSDSAKYAMLFNNFCIDPNNKKRIFAAMGSVLWNAGDTLRVLKSEDGGDSWTDMSTGLTELPVNCIVYQNGSDDVLYVGCDDGVYFWNKPTQCWVKMDGAVKLHDSLPPDTIPHINVVHLEIDQCGGKLIAASYGRGVWTTDLITNQYGIAPDAPILDSLVFGGYNSVFSKSYAFDGSIYIGKGDTLTFKGTSVAGSLSSTTEIHMPRYGAIHVAKGGTLIVDGAKITNGCDMWRGIRAFGDSSWQGPVPGSGGLLPYPNHGLVILKNNAIIENAEEGFSNAAPGSLGGGIIKASNATFYNCRRAAGFMKYSNFHPVTSPPQLQNDASFFSNCTFDVTTDLRRAFERHITMWAVHGVRIDGCKFYNHQANNLDRRSAIGTIESTYSVSVGGAPCTFQGFDMAILVDDYGGSPNIKKALRIYGSEFVNNSYGIVASNCPDLRIKENSFEIGNVPSSACDQTASVYYSIGSKLMYGTKPKLFYKNEFFTGSVSMPNNTSGLQPFLIGSEFQDCGAEDFDIRGNTYDELTYGTTCRGVNGDDSSNLTTGLFFTCNTNQGNIESDYLHYDNGNVRLLQYDLLGAATWPYDASGNVFSVSSVNWHWYEDHPFSTSNGYDLITGTPANQYPSLSNCATGILGLNNTCTRVPDDKPTKIPGKIILAKADFYNNQQIYATAVNNYKVLIDGGNTEALLDEIDDALLSQILQLRTRMLSISPFVTTQALRRLAYENILPPLMLTEVLMANPGGSRDERFLTELGTLIPTPLAPYMLQMVRNSWAGSNYRTELEHLIGKKYMQMELLQRELVESYTDDSLWPNTDSAIVWANKLNTISSKYAEASRLLETKNYAASAAMLASIVATYSLSPAQVQEHNVFQQFLAFKQGVYSSGRDMNALTAEQKAQVLAIAESPIRCNARQMARGILCFFYNTCYPLEHINISAGENKKANVFVPLADAAVAPFGVQVAPNPAQSYVTFALALSPLEKAVSLQVYSSAGVAVHSSALEPTAAIKVLEVGTLPTGNYIYKVQTDKTIYSGSFSIIRN